MNEICLVLDCERVRVFESAFCAHHRASPEEVGHMREQLRALQAQMHDILDVRSALFGAGLKHFNGKSVMQLGQGESVDVVVKLVCAYLRVTELELQLQRLEPVEDPDANGILARVLGFFLGTAR